MNCNNCKAEITAKFCPECGQPAKLKRIDRSYIVHEIEHIIHFERGFLYIIQELVTHPGQNINRYLSENRSRLVKPVIFIIITSLIYTLLNSFFHLEDGYSKYNGGSGEEKSSVNTIVHWIQNHYGYANMMMSVFIAIWLKIFFKKYNYNLYEILIMLCFVMGIGMLIFSVFVIFQGLTNINVMPIAGALGIIYSAWAIGQFYDKKKTINYVKAFLTYCLGMITFWIFPVLIGKTMDYFA